MKIIYGPKAGDYASKSEVIRSVIDRVITAPDFSGELNFSEVRAEGGATTAEWPDGYIHQAAKDMGLRVQL